MKLKRILLAVLLISSVLFLYCKTDVGEEVVEKKEIEKENLIQGKIDVKETEEAQIEKRAEPEVIAKGVETKKYKPVEKKKQVIKEYDIVITSIKKSGSSYQIVLNNQVIVKGVKLDSKNYITFPYSESSGKKYYFVWFDDLGLKSSLGYQLKNNKEKIAKKRLRITSIKIRSVDKNTLKGYADVQLNGILWLKSFPIFIGGKYGDGIGMPSVKSGSDWIKKVMFADKDFEKTVEKKVLDKYYSSR